LGLVIGLGLIRVGVRVGVRVRVRVKVKVWVMVKTQIYEVATPGLRLRLLTWLRPC
jgi:hypothetical protein